MSTPAISTAPDLIYASARFRGAEIARHRRSCYAAGRPFVARYKHGSGRWWTVSWAAEAMTKDRWDPRLTETASQRVVAAAQAALESSYQAGCRTGWGAYGDIRGHLRGISEPEAESLCAQLIAIYADPASFRSLHAPGDLSGSMPWPHELCFDWVRSDQIGGPM